MRRAYGVGGLRSWHHLSDADILAVAVATVLGAVVGAASGVCVGLVVGLGRRRWFPFVACAILAVVGSVAAARSWAEASPRHLGPFIGWAVVAADPVQVGRGMRITWEIEGERFDSWVIGGARATAQARQVGEMVWTSGTRMTTAGNVRRAQTRHVVGTFRVEVLGDVVPGNGLARAGNRVRAALRRSASQTMRPAEAALFTGLVIGDDALQPQWMVAQFRRAGLSHLTAVSGQNVAFVMAAMLPLLRRLRSWWRWAVTVAAILWFMAITRFEPSVLRAGLMAMLSATAFVLGRQVTPLRLVGLAVTLLTVGDPMLVHLVGFWLSVGATLGVCTVGPWCAARLPGPQWLRVSVGISLGAQVGVLLPSLMVFHRVALVSVAANVAAVPVAGLVMLYGLPAGMFASLLPGWLQRLVMAPAALGTRWTATVAQVGAALEPSGVAAVVAWCIALVALAFALFRGHRSRSASRLVPF